MKADSLSQLRRVPVTRLLLVGLGIAAATVAHYVTNPDHYLLHNVFQRLYYIPVLLACTWFGLRAGLATAVISAAVYLPHVLYQWRGHVAYQTSQAVELVMFVAIAVVAGVLADRERALRRQAEEVAAERDRALRDLEASVETLRRADRLATLGTLAASMAHEVRNPLGALGGAVDIVARDFPPDHPRREFIDILRRELGRLSTTVSKYLDFARPQAPDLRSVNLNEAVASAIGLVRKAGERAGVRLELDLVPGLAPALADPVLLHQALVNLVVNGMQAMSHGGVLEVGTEVVGNRGVAVVVRDHGTGLPEGSVERIFEPFFTTRPGGTGLGLAISRQIAEVHDGTLEAENAEGGGARFRLVLRSAPPTL